MTDIAIASTERHDRAAGTDLAEQIRGKLRGVPDAVLVFASSQNDYTALLSALKDETGTPTLVGCSSAGEFTSEAAGTGRTSAIAFRTADMLFSAGVARDLVNDRDMAARALVEGFKGMNTLDYRYRTALVFVDALAGHTDDLIDQLTLITGGMYQFAGGGAGDDGKFEQTHVFIGTEALTNAAVALEILSNKPIGIGARHGWAPASDPLRVTESRESCVVSFNVAPAVEAFEEHAESTHQQFDRENPLPFFLHNIVGVQTEAGHKLRVPLGVADEGGVLCAADVPAGSTAHIMSIGSDSAAEAAAVAARDAMDQVTREGHSPKAALFFDCVATRLRLGQAFGHELDAVKATLGGAEFAGFNSYGQVVRAAGQFSGFHNCTAVVCVFPD